MILIIVLHLVAIGNLYCFFIFRKIFGQPLELIFFFASICLTGNCKAVTVRKNIAEVYRGIEISRYTAVYSSTVTGLAATVLLSGKNFMVGIRHTAVKLYRG